MDIEIRKITEQSALDEAWAVRRIVFVDEQKVDASLEYEHEDESTHFIALVDNKAVGTARWRKTDKGIKLERFAVLKDFRNIKIGQALLLAILRDLPRIEGNVYLHAQAQAESFYARNGFKREGPLFEEAGIPHYKMVLQS